MVRTKQQKPVKGTNTVENNFSTKLSQKKLKSQVETSSNQIENTQPLYQCIDDFIEKAEFFHDHNDSFLIELKEKLISIGQLDWERHHGAEQQELMELYGELGDTDIDEEIKFELEQCLLEATQRNKTELIQSVKNEILKHL